MHNVCLSATAVYLFISKFCMPTTEKKKKEGHISILFYCSVLDIILSMCPFAIEVRS